MITIMDMLEAVLLVTALSIDAFVASFGYGINKIKIPFISAQVINVVCSSILAIAIFLGVAARAIVPPSVAVGVCFIILFALGTLKLFDSIVKNKIRKNKIQRDVKFKFLNVNFILHIYADPEEADLDCSRTLSPGEAVYLAMAVSLDGLTVGFGAGLVCAQPVLVVLFSLILTFAAVMLGCRLGGKIAKKLKFDLSWLSGAILIGLAFMKLF